MLFPVAVDRTGPVELAVVFLLGVTFAFFRLGGVALRGNLWAEDGSVFLQTALLDHGVTTLFEPYSGYMHFAPRAVATLVAFLPLTSQGIALNLAAALIQAAVSTLAYVSTSGFIRQRLLRVLVAFAVVAVPVGPEVIDSIANSQWFLLFGGCLCLLWTPRKPFGWGVLCVVLVSATMNSPFAIVILAGALGRLLVQRSRVALLLAGVSAVGFAVQTAVMLQAPPRAGPAKLDLDAEPARLVAGFVRRVLGDGVFGVGTHPSDQPAPGLLAGVAVVVLLAVLVLSMTTNDGLPVLQRASLFGAFALLTYIMPVVATAGLTTEAPFVDGRYYVAPVLLTIVAIMCMVAAVTDARMRPTLRLPRLTVSVGGALVLTILWGLGSSWTAGNVWGRQHGPSWQPSIAQARIDCAKSSANASASVPISPKGWSMTVPCRLLRE